MSDELAIGGPGAVSVVTTKLEEASRHLDKLGVISASYAGNSSSSIAPSPGRRCVRGTLRSAPSRRSDRSTMPNPRVWPAVPEPVSTPVPVAGGGGPPGTRSRTPSHARLWRQSLAALFGYDLGFLLPVLALFALPAVTPPSAAPSR